MSLKEYSTKVAKCFEYIFELTNNNEPTREILEIAATAHNIRYENLLKISNCNFIKEDMKTNLIKDKKREDLKKILIKNDMSFHQDATIYDLKKAIINLTYTQIKKSL